MNEAISEIDEVQEQISQHPWHTFPQEDVVDPTLPVQSIAEHIKERLLDCQDQHQLNQLLVSFGQSAISPSRSINPDLTF